ncbi:Glucose/sorbosone dehydrogenase [Halanaeroarchaeum sp. HSR-CO]|uniref:PQQ-dependent sugar dehydrogenase n=1 Tax=Halanaeroarchaeum sp. HSR-CO TaxID=2866382 RepID=UPI00217F0DA2|nr:PQQ-dependent sugar dehydrogenase [Halanaeroarchaeum sp. HSR-CO]UWG48565.1 Glucose/sorbosone dehydrogenase [Halanaeroarchaeum sp. HSR-CO]
MTTRSRRAFLAAIGAGVGFLAGCTTGEGPTTEGETAASTETTEAATTTDGIELSTEIVATNLVVPWDFDFDGEGGLYVTERPGRIGRVDLESGAYTRLATVSDTADGGEGGLLGIALHPEFPDTSDCYVYQTYRDDELQNRILRYRIEGETANRVDTVLGGIPGARIHDGGRLAIGPDGYLYASSGDASAPETAQNRESLAGKILRLGLDGSIPSDNPFPGSPVWSLGHRNPEGLAWHPESDAMYAIEHGPSGGDEVNQIDAGANYGWPVVRGDSSESGFEPPVLTSGAGTWAPSGGAFYDGDRISEWRGDLLFATLGFSPGSGRRSLHRVRFDEGGRTVVEHERYLENEFGRLRAVGVGPDDGIYVSTSNRDGRGDPVDTDDRIVRLVST